MAHLPRRQRESFRFQTKLRHTAIINNDLANWDFFLNVFESLIYLSIIKIRFSGKSRAEAAAAADCHASIESGDASGEKQNLDQFVSHLSRMIGSVKQMKEKRNSSCFIRSSIFLFFHFISLSLHKVRKAKVMAGILGYLFMYFGNGPCETGLVMWCFKFYHHSYRHTYEPYGKSSRGVPRGVCMINYLIHVH